MLAKLLGKARSHADLPDVLALYERRRKERADHVIRASMRYGRCPTDHSKTSGTDSVSRKCLALVIPTIWPIPSFKVGCVALTPRNNMLTRPGVRLLLRCPGIGTVMFDALMHTVLHFRRTLTANTLLVLSNDPPPPLQQAVRSSLNSFTIAMLRRNKLKLPTIGIK